MNDNELKQAAEEEYPTIELNELSNKLAGFERVAYIKGYQKAQEEKHNKGLLIGDGIGSIDMVINTHPTE